MRSAPRIILLPGAKNADDLARICDEVRNTAKITLIGCRKSAQQKPIEQIFPDARTQPGSIYVLLYYNR